MVERGMHIEATARAWEDGSLPLEVWQRHETHVLVALWHLVEYGEAEATARMRAGIPRYNAAHGIANTETSGYHETVTIASMRIIAAHVARARPGASLSDLAPAVLRAFPTSKVLLAHYSRDRIMSAEARRTWIEPDLAPFDPSR